MSTTGTLTDGIDTTGLYAPHWVAIGLTLLTGVVHLVLGIRGIVAGEAVGLAVAFVVAALGFFGAVAVVLFGVRRPLLYAAGIPYTAAQVGIWYWLNYGRTGDSLATASPVEAVDKIAQVGLVLLLAYLYVRDRYYSDSAAASVRSPR